MMRIITGRARGVKLLSLEGEQTRPTAERAKEAIFSMLQFEIEDRSVLDLFSGSGQLGLEAVSRGVDFFDCVMPSRNGRHGKLFTWEGTVNILNEKYQTDERPISESCGCPVCRSFSRAYLRHLFKADEVLALRFAVLHNLYFYNELMVRIRAAIDEGKFEEFRARYSGKLEQRA